MLGNIDHLCVACNQCVVADLRDSNEDVITSLDVWDVGHCVLLDERFVYVNQVIASLEAGGVSEVTITKTHAERWAIARGYERSVSRFLLDADYALNLARLHLIQLAKKVLPAPLSRWLTRLKYGKIAGRS